MAEAKARKKCQEVSEKWNSKLTVDQIFGCFKNTEKYTLERQTSLLRQMFKPYIMEFDKHQAQFEADVKRNKKTPIEAFVNFLNNGTIVSKPQKPQISIKPQASISSESRLSSKSDYDSPALSSTRVDSNYKNDVVVSEVNIKVPVRFQFLKVFL